MHSEPVRPPAPVTATFMPDAFVVTGRRSGRVVVSAPANRRDARGDAPPWTEVREESAVVDAMAEAMSTSEELSTGVTPWPKFADVTPLPNEIQTKRSVVTNVVKMTHELDPRSMISHECPRLLGDEIGQ
jgi:hypothetical protein